MLRDVEVVIGGQRFARSVQIGDLATPDHAVERARQQLLDEDPALQSQPFKRGWVVR